MSQESVTTSPYVFPGLLKISGIPGVRHLTGGRGVVQETVDLPLGITAADALHIADVGVVHADEQVVNIVVGLLQLPGGVPAGWNPVGSQGASRRGLDGVSNLLRAGGGGANLKLSHKPGLVDQVFHDVFRHRASANVAVADE